MTAERGSRLRRPGRAFAALLLALALAVRPALAEWRVVPDRVEAAAGPTLRYNVFLPGGYDPARGPYPLLVLLHGAGGDEQSWAGRIRLWRAVEEGIRAGRLPKLIAVMPGARDAWWVDSAFARAETAVVSDLLADVARKYPVMTTREGRAIAGFSAGAYGALRIVLKHPELFGAAALWAPAIYAESPPPLSAARRSPAFAGADGGFDEQAWVRNAWPALLPGYLAQPLRVPLYLAAGDDDRLEIAFEAARLAKALFRHQPEALELRVVDAGHTMRVWEATADEALAFLFAHLARIGLAQLAE
ncbi:MAG: esterase [Elioraea sp.]|nr:MAG: esterase [Elioraea sp.]